MGVMATRGIQLLKELGVEFEVLTYRYDKMGARIAAQAINQPEDIVLKSLVFRADDGSFLFALISGNANISTRKLGRASPLSVATLTSARENWGALPGTSTWKRRHREMRNERPAIKSEASALWAPGTSCLCSWMRPRLSILISLSTQADEELSSAWQHQI